MRKFLWLGLVCIALTIISVVGTGASGGDYARESAISAEEIYAARDIAILRERLTVRWQPPSPEFISQYRGEPEIAGMREEFGLWLMTLLNPQFLPADLVASAPYLRRATGAESRYHSHFYAAYEIPGDEILVQGFLDQVQVLIRPANLDLGPEVENHLAEARAIQEMNAAGVIGAGKSYAEAASRDLKTNLREVAEKYINPASLPAGEDAWEDVLSRIGVVNGGFAIDWHADGYKDYLSPEAAIRLEGSYNSLSLWINGRVIRLRLDHYNVWAHDMAAFVSDMPQPRVMQAPLLNPQALEVWDAGKWFGDDGPVDDVTRASSMVIRLVAKAGFAPDIGVEESWGPAPGRPGWSNEFELPMSALKWQVAEFGALVNASAFSLARQRYLFDNSAAGQLAKATDRAALLDEFETKRAAAAAIADRFAALRYPGEVQAERNALLEALHNNAQAWQVAIEYWRPVVDEFPEATEAFYLLKADGFTRELAARGLAETVEELQAAHTNAVVPLYERFGLQRPAP